MYKINGLSNSLKSLKNAPLKLTKVHDEKLELFGPETN